MASSGGVGAGERRVLGGRQMWKGAKVVVCARRVGRIGAGSPWQAHAAAARAPSPKPHRPAPPACSDDAGEGGAALLAPDELTVTLRAGAPHALAFDGPAALSCGTRSALGDLRLRVVDAWANLVDAASFEVGCRRGDGSLRTGGGVQQPPSRGCGDLVARLAM